MSLPVSDPCVSILIPNFNNGRGSSSSGDVDLLGDLLRSLHDTLADDPTPLEIILCDDGSTDDSRDTARTWADRAWGGWRGDTPFLHLIEREHCGVLSITANILTRTSRGDICVRLDGDITCSTPRWAEKLAEAFANGPPDLGIIGPVQLGIDGRIHSAGDWLLHPRGNHHIAAGASPQCITRSIEVDHVMGCFYCYRREVFDEVDGFDEDYLRGQTIDFGLKARRAGWRCMVVPTIQFVHRHALRTRRSTKADTGEGIGQTLDTFERKWGFNRLAPDLDVVRERYAGTPLLWNARVFGPALDWPLLRDKRVEVTDSEWAHYAQRDDVRTRIDSRRMIARAVLSALPARERIVHWHCGPGVLTHFMAKDGVPIIGVDPDRHFIALAREVTAREQYPTAPGFAVQTDRRKLPMEDQSADAVFLFDVVERHPNPVALFVEAHRVLKPGGVLAIVTVARTGPFDADHDGLHCYRPHELKLQLEGTRRFIEYAKVTDGSAGSLIVHLAQAVPNEAMAASEGTPVPEREMASAV